MVNREGGYLQGSATYIADTHALYWYLRHPERLSAAADAVFRLAESGNALIVVPAIVVAELYFLSVKIGQPFSVSELLEEMEGVDGISLTDLGKVQLEQLDAIADISEMHDRLIAAESVALNAPIVTRDGIIRQSQYVSTIW